MAEGLGRGLQNLVRRFESAPDLQIGKPSAYSGGLCYFWEHTRAKYPFKSYPAFVYLIHSFPTDILWFVGDFANQFAQNQPLLHINCPKMNFKAIGIAGLLLLITSRILFLFGFDFMYAQKPIDYAHWLMLIGSVLCLSFTFVFPKSIFNTIGTSLTILGVIAHIGMCTIDFILWSYGNDYESRNELLGHLMNTPAIWLPFIAIGPALFYAGLSTHAWQFIRSHTLSAILAIVGAVGIGLGQVALHNQQVVVVGYVVFTLGMGLLAYRKVRT